MTRLAVATDVRRMGETRLSNDSADDLREQAIIMENAVVEWRRIAEEMDRTGVDRLQILGNKKFGETVRSDLPKIVANANDKLRTAVKAAKARRRRRG